MYRCFIANTGLAGFYPCEYELGRLLIEDRYYPPVPAELREQGYKLLALERSALGRVYAFEKQNGALWSGNASPRPTLCDRGLTVR